MATVCTKVWPILTISLTSRTVHSKFSQDHPFNADDKTTDPPKSPRFKQLRQQQRDGDANVAF